MPHRILPDTSLEAKESLKEKDIKALHKRIVEALGVLGSATAEQIADYLGVDHVVVARRMSELGVLGKCHRPGEKLPTKTGRSAYTWRLGVAPIPEHNVYKKGEKNAADFAEKIIEHKINKVYVQPALFDDNVRELEKSKI